MTTVRIPSRQQIPCWMYPAAAHYLLSAVVYGGAGIFQRRPEYQLDQGSSPTRAIPTLHREVCPACPGKSIRASLGARAFSVFARAEVAVDIPVLFTLNLS